MKEILKYLRKINCYSQETVANAISLSRQSYNKYENGSVIPSEKILQKLADFYGVEKEFIKANQIPELPLKLQHYSDYSYPNISKTELFVTENTSSYKPETYDAIVKNGSILLTGTDFLLKEGQHLKITIEGTESIDRTKALRTIDSLIGKFKLPEEFKNLSDDEIKNIALREKYGPF